MVSKRTTWIRASALWLLSGTILLAALACAGGGDAEPTALATSSTSSSTATGEQSVAFDDESDPFFCYAEILTADRPSEYGYMAARGCVPSGEFRRGERVVFRFQILDRRTGDLITAEDAEEVVLRLPAGESVVADYKQRGEGKVSDAPWTWDACWDVPLDYPLGSIDYYFEISTKDGRHGTWKPPSLVDATRGIDSRPHIIPADPEFLKGLE